MEAFTTETRTVTLVSRITYFILGIIFLLIPVFFLPSTTVSLMSAKGALVVVGVVIAFVSFVISLIQEGRFAFPKNLLSLSLIIIPLSVLISAIFSNTFDKSFIGYGIEAGGVVFILSAVFLTFLTGFSFEKKERGFYAYLIFFASFVFVALYQFIRIIAEQNTLSFGIFHGTTSNLLGSWNDLSIFFGLTAILSIVTIEMLKLNKLFKTLAFASLIISICYLAVVNFSTTWWVISLFSLIFFLYVISFDRFSQSQEFSRDVRIDGGESNTSVKLRKISFVSLALLLVSLVFVFFGTAIGEKIATNLNIASLEVRPSWGTTYSVISSSLKDNLLTGAGPNNFASAWMMHKPSGINETVFWNTDFSFGIGFIPSLFATTGLVGILSWIFFFISLLWLGVRAIFQPISDLFSRYLLVSSFITTLFLWFMTIVYVPGVAMIAMTFFFTGLFIASLYREKLLKQVPLSLVHHPKLSFITVLFLVVLLIGGLSLGYLVVQKTLALSYYQKGIIAAQQENNIDKAEEYIVKAINTRQEDVFYRALSEVKLVRVDQALLKPNATAESVREEFQRNTADAIENARRATEISPQNYQNWLSLARVYAALVPPPFSIPGAYENAKKIYEEAFKLNPSNPNIPLLLARLEVSNGDLKAARSYVEKSIALKSNYAEAHFLSAQIEVTEGNISQAIPSLETAIILSPQNAGLFFQLGLLKYNDRNWSGAIEAFGNAIKMVPEYANARYFLGLALERVGERQAAIAQFEELAKTNSDNKEVTLILDNLKSGKSPFTDVKAPLDNKPEKRATLPIKDN